MKTTIEKGASVVTLINVFTVDPIKQEALVRVLDEATEKVIKDMPGFVSANTYERPNQIGLGVKDLLIGGIFVIRNGALDTNAFPGQPVRRSGAPATSDDAHEQ